MPKLWMLHTDSRVRKIEDGRAACPMHAGGAPVELCRACPRFVSLIHEGHRSSVLCRVSPRQTAAPDRR
jgi:hypothetical protein